MSDQQKPSIGRIVLYYHHNGALIQKPMAAIITDVANDGSGDVLLHIFDPTRGARTEITPVPHRSKAQAPGRFWDWPPRV